VVLPPAYTFTAADAGVHTFPKGVTLFTVGTQTLTATDPNGPAGMATVMVKPRAGGIDTASGARETVHGPAVTAAATPAEPEDAPALRADHSGQAGRGDQVEEHLNAPSTTGVFDLVFSDLDGTALTAAFPEDLGTALESLNRR
jgi:hypothetical protein